MLTRYQGLSRVPMKAVLGKVHASITCLAAACTIFVPQVVWPTTSQLVTPCVMWQIVAHSCANCCVLSIISLDYHGNATLIHSCASGCVPSIISLNYHGNATLIHIMASPSRKKNDK